MKTYMFKMNCPDHNKEVIIVRAESAKEAITLLYKDHKDEYPVLHEDSSKPDDAYYWTFNCFDDIQTSMIVRSFYT